MSCNQAVDNYLGEKLNADVRPNDMPYSDGAAYTGKEHSWDEAFGYFRAAANSLMLSAEDNCNVVKMKNFAGADANGGGVIDLKSERVFNSAYYAAGADKSGKTAYVGTIMRACLNGRALIASADGEALTN